MTNTEPASPPPAATDREPDARRNRALLVGIAATIAFVVLRFVVALGGHTAVATAVVVTLAMALRRWYVWMLGAAWNVLMMWSKTYPHAHWLSDVVAGMLEGLAVATLAWCAVEAWRDRRSGRRAGACFARARYVRM